MIAKLLGIGTALPKHAISQLEAAELAKSLLADENSRLASLLPKLYSKSGVQQRYCTLLQENNGQIGQSFYRKSEALDAQGPGLSSRMQLYEEQAPRLAQEACKQAFDASNINPQQITHLVTVSCTGFSAPGIDVALIRSLGLPATVERTHIGFMGCHGSINGLRCATALAQSNPRAVVLVCAVELCSLHYHYGEDPEQIVANALFADGAAAALVSANAGEGIAKFSGFGSYLFPDSEEAMSWRIGDNSFAMTLSAAVPIMIQNKLAPWLDQWLSRYDLQRKNIQNWAVHPGGPRILTAVEQALDLNSDDLVVSRKILAEVGNMSSPTLLFIAKQLLSTKLSRPLVFVGFGPGLVAETALLS